MTKKSLFELLPLLAATVPNEVEAKVCRGNAERIFWRNKPENSTTKLAGHRWMSQKL